MTLDVLVKITPPAPNAQVPRPALNLGLVLDRSGSMAAHNKIGFAREAAVFAVQQLLPTDRVSVTIFDDQVETIVPNTPAEDKGRIVDLIRRVQPGGSTALHGGWKEGGRQVSQHLLAGGLNRVLLLSDGLANVGETNPDAIATDVNRLAREGVSTTTMGVGDDYNEDLLEAMARSGDGNYYYIEVPAAAPRHLPDRTEGADGDLRQHGQPGRRAAGRRDRGGRAERLGPTPRRAAEAAQPRRRACRSSWWCG